MAFHRRLLDRSGLRARPRELCCCGSPGNHGTIQRIQSTLNQGRLYADERVTLPDVHILRIVDRDAGAFLEDRVEVACPRAVFAPHASTKNSGGSRSVRARGRGPSRGSLRVGDVGVFRFLARHAHALGGSARRREACCGFGGGVAAGRALSAGRGLGLAGPGSLRSASPWAWPARGLPVRS